ncbi:MAG: DUF1320 family protein [Bacteroidetes bacterium]|nr:DUF1320 family protein [Bacteroidota bacterium]
MAFLTDSDYKSLICNEDLDIVIQSDIDTKTKAELMGIEQMTGYLNQRFDCEAIFTAENGDRNHLVVMFLVDIVLYHLYSSLPNRLGLEQRRIRYEDALKWLKDVANGLITPPLPTPDLTVATDPLPSNWGCETRKNYSW